MRSRKAVINSTQDTCRGGIAIIHRAHSAVQPPSIKRADPVTMAEASEARKRIPPIKSSTWPRRPILIFATALRTNSSSARNGRVTGVSMKVGQIVLTRMR